MAIEKKPVHGEFKKHVDILKNYTEHGTKEYEVIGALQGLGQTKHKDAFPHIVKFLESKIVDYRLNAIWALEDLGMERALPRLAEHFKKRNERMFISRLTNEQIHILNAMLKINREKALPMIIELHGKADELGKRRIERILKKIEGGKDGN